MMLTKHFSLSEFVRSETAEKLGIDNTPPEPTLKNIKVLAEGLEKIRAILDVPMLISSGYRSKELNRKVGGVDNSDHRTGYAADFVAPKFGSVEKICKAIKDSGIPVDQCINELNRWVHVSFSPRMRNEHFRL